ncbi:hypothetical protein CH306_25090 [Rhodococcus sp. 15-725-2-2b]|nr:hypothetical protein CH277_23100 [Rhodococcus sp. 06-469-3-2]OZD31012.1 hypothetical protein CH284_23155 [Rhodococcus sp. 06-156-3]OZD69380.1 hypothetical protein CH271_08955 [Rhodococcus sp. 05-340-2]OZD72849.1 hypothetical protein CH272_22475 [Rhodococcus sp. 05-340-1]OZE60673.1 hypothetical protein CH265_19805 [Rhodococcus sp. 05-2221-1B]OZE67373.1 hypothetical protein CH306_25090 [Rhodococcus sp. 15-725-2-2b]OZE73280.1 hypothetical protein CH305_27030 [Rhodococcus sp. 15-649-2-2]OZE94
MQAYLEELGFEVAHTSAPDVWALTEPAASMDCVDFMTVRTLSGSEADVDDELVDLPQDPYVSRLDHGRVVEERLRAIRQMSAGAVGSFLYGLQLPVITASDRALSAAVQDASRELAGTSDDDDEHPFDRHAVHVVRYGNATHRRIRFPGFVLRLNQDPELLDDIRRGPIDVDETIFASGSSILSSVLIPASHLGPLLAARSPWVWAFQANRVSGAVIFTLGTDIVGRSPVPYEAHQVLPRSPVGRLPQRQEPPAPEAWGAAVAWWVAQMNSVLGHLLNPCLFADADGDYLPYAQQNRLMEFADLLQRVTSTLLSLHDDYAAGVLMWSAMDLIEATWLSWDLTALCKPSVAAKALQQVRERMPADVQSVLLPYAAFGVEALTEVGDGFFIKNYRRSEKVILKLPGGADKSLSLDDAVSQFMRLRRNTTHGFDKPDPVRDRLFAQHNGRLPATLMYLPLLYLMYIMSDPDDLRRRLLRRSARRRRTQ